MAIEYFDQEQGKPIEKLEETLILEDESSFFLVSMDNITRKVNLLSMIKMMSGDNNDSNSEYKFYSTTYLNSKMSEIYQSIRDMDAYFDEFTEMIEEMKTKIDTSIKSFEKIVNGIDPKLRDLENKLQAIIDERCNQLAQECVTINNKVIQVENDYKLADAELREYIEQQFHDLFNQIQEGGDISAQMFNVLQNSIDDLRTLVNNMYATLRAKDTELEDRIIELENRVDDIGESVTNNYYNKEEIDQFLQDIYNRISVKIVSSPTDVDGNRHDANNYTEDGFIFFTLSAELLNIPSTAVNGVLHTINFNDGPIKQLFYRYGTMNVNDHHIFIRTRMAGNWTEWARILTTKDIIYGTEVPTNLETGQIYLQYFI
ncbi:MAG: hypothetical protein PHC62_00525 [Candidatus Izemoplasmatales bacterium]|nr:hypothetical protein [Candidatus Izemoplasmatales bacterium]